MKKILWIVLALVIAALGWLWWKNKTSIVTYNPGQTASTTSPTASSTTTFTSADNSITFTYPATLKVSQKNNIITISHSINFTHTNACDFKGTGGTSPTLTDFNVTMQEFNMNIASSAATFDPSIATSSRNADGTLALSPGSIDPYNEGPFNGYMVTEGVEGCGSITYYLPISYTRTLVIQKQLIGELSGVADPDQQAKILATPGAISNDQSTQIFNSIIQSLQVH